MRSFLRTIPTRLYRHAIERVRLRIHVEFADHLCSTNVGFTGQQPIFRRLIDYFTSLVAVVGMRLTFRRMDADLCKTYAYLAYVRALLCADKKNQKQETTLT